MQQNNLLTKKQLFNPLHNYLLQLINTEYCELNHCNVGNCVETTSGNKTELSCDCPLGYTGVNCEKR